MFPAVRVEISVDGGEFTRHRARTVVVGNVGFLQAGMPLLPDAAIDDGLLDVVLLHPRNFLSWIPLACRVLLKRKHTDELVNRMTGRTVVVRAAADTPRQLDGDSIGPGRELRMSASTAGCWCASPADPWLSRAAASRARSGRAVATSTVGTSSLGRGRARSLPPPRARAAARRSRR